MHNSFSSARNIEILFIIYYYKKYLLNIPSTPEAPIPSTMSLVNLKGTVSGVGKTRPCSKAIPVYRI